MTFLPRDFIEIGNGLVFAVVHRNLEDRCVLCFLRYLITNDGYKKLSTEAANAYLRSNAAHYLYHSKLLDAFLHAVPIEDILNHYRPRDRVHELRLASIRCVIEKKLVKVLDLFVSGGVQIDNIGVTGSILIGAQHEKSDIDIVIYGRDSFFDARKIIAQSIDKGSLGALSHNLWLDAYERRRCSNLSFDEFLWYERRKLNKASIEGTKFDLTLVNEPVNVETQKFRKLGFRKIKAKVLDDRYSFDYPARYILNHKDLPEAVSFTSTYTGQALAGENIEILGQIEETECGLRRLVVGSDREASGEYIKVLSDGCGAEAVRK